MSSIAIQPVTTTYDINQFTITDVYTDINNSNIVITFDLLDASSSVKQTKSIVATGSDFKKIINMDVVQEYIVNTEKFILDKQPLPSIEVVKISSLPLVEEIPPPVEVVEVPPPIEVVEVPPPVEEIPVPPPVEEDEKVSE